MTVKFAVAIGQLLEVESSLQSELQGFRVENQLIAVRGIFISP